MTRSAGTPRSASRSISWRTSARDSSSPASSIWRLCGASETMSYQARMT